MRGSTPRRWPTTNSSASVPASCCRGWRSAIGSHELAARGTSRPRAARHGECATETRRHREFLGFLRVSVPLLPMALCLAGRVNFHHGLLGYNHGRGNLCIPYARSPGSSRASSCRRSACGSSPPASPLEKLCLQQSASFLRTRWATSDRTTTCRSPWREARLQSCGIGCPTILYDRLADRWLIAQYAED